MFTSHQALQAGWTARQVRHRRAAGHWRRLAGQGLIARTTAPTPLSWAWAATLTWPEAVLGHRTAACLHDLPVEAVGGAIVVVEDGRRRAPFGIQVHQVAVPDCDVVVRGDGLRLTTLIRTAIDCLGALPFDESLDLWAWLSTRQIMTRRELSQHALARTGWHGTPQLVRLLRYTRFGAVSGAEWRLHELLRRAGISGWRAGVTLHDRDGVPLVVDVVFLAQRVILEVDGWRYHQGHDAFIRDRRRIRRLTAMGYVVLPITWDDLVNRPAELLAEIAAVLAARATA